MDRTPRSIRTVLPLYRRTLREVLLPSSMVRVGLAMLQGARHEHAEALRAASIQLHLDLEIIELRSALEVGEHLDCLVLPGGESTAMRKASQSESLLTALFSWMKQFPQRPVLGTCAGAILLANPGGNHTPFLRAGISRNAWGRQRESFEAEVEVSLEIPTGRSISPQTVKRDQFNHQPLPVGDGGSLESTTLFHGVFIRAPRFEQSSIECTPVVTLGEEIVGVLDGPRLALTFHPELTGDYRFHRWLIHQANTSQ
jgi:5'-phosphate synthase pdxT subunit